MSKRINHPDSMNDVVDTMGSVLQTFINDVVKEEMPNCSYIYDPQLSYESALALFRQANNMEGRDQQNSKDPLPMFAFSRSALRYPELAPALHRRAANNKGHYINENGDEFLYSMVYGEMELQFLYINKNMKELEQFEITHLANDGISGTREITVNLPELGDFNYHIEYDDLLDVDLSIDGNYFKTLAGTIRIRGFYFIFRSEAPVIRSINLNIRQSGKDIINSAILSNCTINS
jgi:hypothetical protein